MPDGCDEAIWQYEHLLELTKELGLLSVALNQVCGSASCPVMKATDQWRFLCAAHKAPKECSAIDYALHTLEGTSAMLCSDKYFPCEDSVPVESIRYFQSIARRLYRILAHAFYHHAATFQEFEVIITYWMLYLCLSDFGLRLPLFYYCQGAHHTCARFEEFVLTYKLMPEKLLIIRTCGTCS